MGKITRVILILAERNNWHLDKIMAWILENKSRPSERIFFFDERKIFINKEEQKKKLATSFIPHNRGKTRGTTTKIKGAKKNYKTETTLLENGLPYWLI